MAKGGMCTRPFAGFLRPDKLDARDFLPSNAPWQRILLLQNILDAFQQYAYFGIGSLLDDGRLLTNGTTPGNFWHDYNYLFLVRSSIRSTWEHARVMNDTFVDETGKRRTRRLVLTDKQLVAMCFDVHFELVNLPGISMEVFLEMVHEHRKEVLRRSGPQIRNYIQELRRRSVEEYKEGHSLPLFDEESERDMQILLDPKSPEEVAKLVGYDAKCFRPKRVHKQSVPTYKPKVVEVVFSMCPREPRQEGPTLTDVLDTTDTAAA